MQKLLYVWASQPYPKSGIGRTTAFSHDDAHRPDSVDDFEQNSAIFGECGFEFDAKFDQRIFDFFRVLWLEFNADFAARMRQPSATGPTSTGEKRINAAIASSANSRCARSCAAHSSPLKSA